MTETSDFQPASLDVVELVPQSLAERYEVVPVSRDGDLLTLGSANAADSAENQEAAEMLGAILEMRIAFIRFESQQHVLDAIVASYPTYDENFTFGDVIHEFREEESFAPLK